MDRVLHLLLSREHLGRCGWWTGVCVCAVHVHGWPQCDHTLPWMEECVVTTAVEELQHPPVRFAWCVQRPQTGGSRCETRLKRACSMYPYRRTSRRTAVTSTARAKYPAAPKQPGFHILFLLSNLTRKTTLGKQLFLVLLLLHREFIKCCRAQVGFGSKFSVLP